MQKKKARGRGKARHMKVPSKQGNFKTSECGTNPHHHPLIILYSMLFVKTPLIHHILSKRDKKREVGLVIV